MVRLMLMRPHKATVELSAGEAESGRVYCEAGAWLGVDAVGGCFSAAVGKGNPFPLMDGASSRLICDISGDASGCCPMVLS